MSNVRTPVFGKHRVFGTSDHYGKAHGSLLSGWMNYNYTACCWFPTSNNILILPSQFWQISFESYWLHCSKCRILVLLWYWVAGLLQTQRCTCTCRNTGQLFALTSLFLDPIWNSLFHPTLLDLVAFSAFQMVLPSEVDPGFSINVCGSFWRGAQKIMCAQRILRPGFRALKGPGRSRVLDALWWMSEPYFEAYSNTKLDTKTHSQ